MYVYDEMDARLAEERIAQFADQTRHFLNGRLPEDDFRAMGQLNGLSIARHAPVLRIAMPYGMLDTRQLRTLAHIARRRDRGYAHLCPCQAIQFNWLLLKDVPTVLTELLNVRMHALRTDGYFVRCMATDPLAGIAPDEVVNPLVWCELIRQWFVRPLAFDSPRQFEIAVTGARMARAGVGSRGIALQAIEQDEQIGFRAWSDGQLINPFVAWPHLLTYLQAIINISVPDLVQKGFAEQMRREWMRIKDGPGTIQPACVDRAAARFTSPDYDPTAADADDPCEAHALVNPTFARWLRENVHGHRVPGYASVTVSLKKTGVPPGSINADQMDAAAGLADRYGYGELRVSHEQNLIFTDVRQHQLHRLWRELDVFGLAGGL